MQTLIKLIESSYLLVSQALSYLLRTIKIVQARKKKTKKAWNGKTSLCTSQELGNKLIEMKKLADEWNSEERIAF